MKNSKYIKVSVSERMPEVNTNVIVLGDMDDVAIGYVSQHNNWWQYGSDTVDNIDYWLLEVPDYEEEMKDVLLQLLGCHTCGHKIPDWLNDKAEELLTKIKQQS